MSILKTIIFTLIVPGTFAVLIPYLLVSKFDSGNLSNYLLFSVAGIFLLCIGVGIYLWCAWEFARAQGTPAPIDPPKELVVKGLYKFTRNPMYVGVICILLGESLFFGSPAILLYLGSMFIVFQAFIMLYEEKTLTRKFGDGYRKYCESVPRWFL